LVYCSTLSHRHHNTARDYTFISMSQQGPIVNICKPGPITDELLKASL
jgi:hypothetical protein